MNDELRQRFQNLTLEFASKIGINTDNEGVKSAINQLIDAQLFSHECQSAVDKFNFIEDNRPELYKEALKREVMSETFAREQIVKELKKDQQIDLSSVFDGTTPLTEHHVEKLLSVMKIKEIQDDDELPKEIRFFVPSASSDDKMTRYVHLDSMPKELQVVIRNYLNLPRHTCNKLSSHIVSSKIFCDAVKKFAESVEANFSDVNDK